MRQRAALKGWETRRANDRARAKRWAAYNKAHPPLSKAERIRQFWRSVIVRPTDPNAKWWRFVKRVNSR